MKRSIITFIVFLAVQCGLSQGTGYWDLPSKSINGLNYFLFEETGEVMVADENCWEGELVLPTVVNWDGHDYPVKYLASRAFANCKSLTRVIIPENIQDILFYVSYLGNRDIIKSPFQGCSQLESIEVAENNRWLCSVDGVLYKHDRTQLFNYPSGASRTHFAIPEGVETIGTAAFRGSANLTSVSIPNTVNQIFEEAFYDCDNIKQIDIPDNISTIKISTFHGCSKLKSIHLPDNLTEIENAAFFGCLSLKEIVFPEKLQTLGGAVFRGCQLETVVIKGYLYDYSIKNLLQDLNESAKLYVPASEVDRYKSLYSGTVLPLEEYEGRKETQEYFPEGTKWTEIRLDTLKYDSWYSKVGDEWVPNFETIEYRVQGIYSNFSETFGDNSLKCVYTNCSEWTDSLSLLIVEGEINEYLNYGRRVMATVPIYFDTWDVPSPAMAYNFDWRVGMPISFIDILSTTYDHNSETAVFGIIEEINEENFGGVRPLNYTDVNGVRIIQGIGVTTWNDGECIFGPVRPYDAMAFHQGIVYPERHYRSMLVHFERDGEVLYDVWPRKGSTVEVAIDGLNYFLYLDRHEAVLTSRNNCSGEVDIPSEVRYNDETFVVKSMTHTAFHNNSELTKVRIPKTIEEIIHYYPVDPDWLDPPTGMANPIYVNPFKGCTALESIEVDEENPCMKSIDGVLFSQDGVGQYYYKTGSYSGTGLYCYPEGVRQESYTIPESVEWIGGAAFPNNQYLTTLTIPNSMKHICYDAFSGCCNLTDVYCYAENVPIAWDGAFRNVPIASATLHVPAGSVDAYKATAPWSGFGDIVAIEEIAQEYFPEGTKWTEIRLDTKRFDSWYSKVGDEWVPNFETIEYRVQGEYTDHNLKFKKVYSNGPEWTDSLALLIYDNGYDKRVSASVLVQDLEYVLWPAEVYQFDWNIGIRLWFQDLLEANATCYPPCGLFNYGIIDEIKEGYFGGVRPLKYVDLNGKAPSDPKQPWLDYADTNGGRIIQGIGITEWNDGECLFGPPNPYSALSNYEYLPQRHYRSMLVHFESGGEVLYDVWPKKEAIEVESVTFTRDQMATIILPTEPDASKGKYYRLDRVEGNEIVFEQELQPCAHVPYIIVPSEDFSIEVSAMELDGLRCDTASVEGISFIGTYQKEEVESQEGFYIELIDTTPDCSLSPSGEAGRDVYTIGTLRAYLLVHWDDPYHPGGTKVPAEKMEIVLKDNPNSIEIVNSKSSNSKCYDLSGKMVNRKSSNSKFPRGIYIEGGKVKIY